MKVKYLLCFILASAMITACRSAVSDGQSKTAMVAHGDVPMLMEPTLDSEVVRFVQKGDTLSISTSENGFVLVESEGQASGWIDSKHLKQ